MRRIGLIVMMVFPLIGWAQDSTGVSARLLDEVVVSSEAARQRIESVQIGAERIEVEQLTAAPVVLGEADLMRSMQLLPGVKAESDASSCFEVRGGTSVQNAILYDDVPVYNIGHLAGLFSAFNTDALASAILYKGFVPAQFGGASSAVLDVVGRMALGNRIGGRIGVGLLSAKASLETRTADDRLGIRFNVRRSYADMFLGLSNKFRGNTLYFYDTNLKTDWRLNDRNDLMLSLFVSHDKTELKDMVGMGWTNLAGSLAWLHRLGARATSQTTLLASAYDTDNNIDLLGTTIAYQGHIRHTGVQQNFRLFSGRHEFNIGAQMLLTDVKSAEWKRMSLHEKERRRALDNAVWVNWQAELLPRLAMSAGLRFTAFSALGGPYYYDIDAQGNITWIYKRSTNRPVKTYLTFEPRLSLAWRATEQLSVKAGFSRTSQNIHALRNQSTTTPFDRYAISSNIIKPELANHWSLGAYMMTRDGAYDCSVEGYFRQVDNVTDYRDGISFASAIEIERLVLAGEGRGYGLEFSVHKNRGQLTGWLSYTLSWSRTRIDGINGGRWYDANNDRRHDINIVATYRLSPAWTFNGVWVFNSGQAFTAPSAKYEMIDNYIYYYAERNGYRAPDYHHLDISATWTKPVRNGRTREWVFGIYNLYNRYNPYLIRFEDSANGKRTKATQYSLFGIVPSVSFNYKW